MSCYELLFVNLQFTFGFQLKNSRNFNRQRLRGLSWQKRLRNLVLFLHLKQKEDERKKQKEEIIYLFNWLWPLIEK
jgi:hypothetical protein